MSDDIMKIVPDIEDMLNNRKFHELRSMLSAYEPEDVAVIFDEVEEESIPILFRILPKEMAAECFVEMDSDHQKTLIEAFSDKELTAVVSDLFVDDTVDIIEEMPANVVKRILLHADPQKRKEINELLHYPKDSTGAIMTTEFVELKPDMTGEEVFRNIRNTGVDKETIYTCYVTDNARHLIGVVTVKDILTAPDDDITVGDLMEDQVISVGTLDDKEETARTMSKYDLMAIPVVDNENRLVGIVTYDDAMDVIESGDTEDIEIMAAITPTDKPYLKTGVFATWLKRIPWLLLLMVSATFTSKILQHFEDALTSQAAMTALIAFIPMLMDTGGNAGGQVSVTVIRGLSLGEISMGDILRILWKEIRVAVLCGITLSAVNFGKMMILDHVSMSAAAVVSVTIVAVVIIAKLVGATLPIVAKRIGFDPAVMASPFITTIVDALSLLVYFNVAKLIIGSVS